MAYATIAPPEGARASPSSMNAGLIEVTKNAERTKTSAPKAANPILDMFDRLTVSGAIHPTQTEIRDRP